MNNSQEQELYYPDLDAVNGNDLKIYLIGREQVSPGVSCNRVLRKHYIFHFITGGKGVFRQGSNFYPVEKGQVFLITPDVFCSYTADEKDPYSYIWVEFDSSCVNDYLSRCGISQHSPIYTGIDISCMEYLETMIDSHPYTLRIQAYFLFILDKMIQNCPEDKRLQTESAEPPGELYIRHAVRYISLLQIASALGYSDQFTFSKAFKKQKSMPPSVWRQQYA